MRRDQDEQYGPRCICGEYVACYHQECLLLLDDKELESLKERGKVA